LPKHLNPRILRDNHRTGSQLMKYLLSISIGPVQDFIATARRSRDLWFGSWLLREIRPAVAERFDDKS
jgi:hypothetical protein